MGRIPEHNLHKGKELTINFGSFNIHNNGTFYTDSNGLRMIERKSVKEIHEENTGSFYKHIRKLSVAANFYPVSTGLMIEDPDRLL
jgi:hypothetical protein